MRRESASSSGLTASDWRLLSRFSILSSVASRGAFAAQPATLNTLITRVSERLGEGPPQIRGNRTA